MVVVAIIGLLTSIAAVNVYKRYENAKSKTARSEIAGLADAVGAFYFDVGRFPQSLDELVTKTGDKKWDGPYLTKTTVPNDPWGQPYHYDCPGKNGDFDIYSYGKDGRQGGEGADADISNWE
jgi:general secretion pathway protein G